MNAQRMKKMLMRDLDIFDRLDQELGRKDLPPLGQMLDELFYRRFLSSVLRDYHKCSKHILHLFTGELNRIQEFDNSEIESLNALTSAPPFILSEDSLLFIQTLEHFVNYLDEKGCIRLNTEDIRDLLFRLPGFSSNIKNEATAYLAGLPE